MFKFKLCIPCVEQLSVSQSQPIVSNLNETRLVALPNQPSPEISLFHLCQIKLLEFVFFWGIQDRVNSLLAHRSSKHEDTSVDFIIFVKMGVHLYRMFNEFFCRYKNGFPNNFVIDSDDFTSFHNIIDFIFKNLMEMVFGAMADKMIVLTQHCHSFIIHVLRHGWAHNELEGVWGSKPGDLLWLELEIKLKRVDTFKIFKIDESYPHFFQSWICLIWAICFDHEKWSNRLIVMQVRDFFLEQDKGLGCPLVEVWVFVLGSFSGRQTILHNKNLFLKLFRVLDVHQEAALVQINDSWVAASCLHF